MFACKIYSCIKTELKRKALIRGVWFGGFGVLLMLFGTFLPAAVLSVWGRFLLAASMAFIAYGWIPYRRLCCIEAAPEQIIIHQERHCSLIRKKQAIFTVPFDAISHIAYQSHPLGYGIGIYLKRNHKKKALIHSQKFNPKNSCKHVKKSFGSDLFIPYFSKKSFEKLKGFINDFQRPL